MTLLAKKIENELLQDSNVEDAQRRIARIMQKYDLDAYEVVLDETKYDIRLVFPDHGGTIRIIVNDARMLFPDQWEFRNVLLRLLEHV